MRRPHKKIEEQDRRIAHRYAVQDDRAWLGWYEGGAFRTAAARIVNMSQTGALLEVAGPHPQVAGEAAWVRPEGGEATDWIEGTVVGIKAERRGPQRVRFAFRDACPYDLFKSAVYGAGSLAGPPEAVPKDPRGRDWW